MKKVFRYSLDFLKREPILIAATIAAIVTAFFVKPDEGYLSYINWRTIAGLCAIFISIKGLERTRLFRLVSVKILSHVTSSRALVTWLVFIPTFTSTFITNDVSVVLFVPFSIIVLTMCGMQRYVLKTVILICVGTSLTGLISPIANAQNIYLFAYYNLPFEYMITYGWGVAIVGFGLLFACCMFTKNENIETFDVSDVKLRTRRLPQFIILFILSVMTIVINSVWFYWVVLVIVVITALIIDKKSLKRTRYISLLTYVMFFIFAGNLKRIPLVDQYLLEIIDGREYYLAIAMSELMSNTPAAVVLSQFSTNTLPLMLGLNVSKVGTIQASMISILAMSTYLNFDNRPLRFLGQFLLYGFGFLIVLSGAGLLTLYLYGAL